MPFLLLVGLILIHEVGHFLTAFLLGIEVDKICIHLEEYQNLIFHLMNYYGKSF